MNPVQTFETELRLLRGDLLDQVRAEPLQPRRRAALQRLPAPVQASPCYAVAFSLSREKITF
jgi:hypothetical protein